MTPTTPAAGTDPAFFSGIVPPQPDAPGTSGNAPEAAGDAVPAALRGSAGRKPEPAAVDEPAEAAAAADRDETADDAEAVEDADAEDAAADEVDAEEDAEEDVDDGKPVFEASDRRAAIIADRHGVTFTLDGETAEFGWDEIGAVEVDSPRFGKRFGVTVYTSARRWFQCDVEAPSRSTLKQWSAELDAVLDVRFDDEKPEAAEEPDEPSAEAAEAGSEEQAGPEDETSEAKAGEKSDEEAETTPDAKSDEKSETKDSASADA
ncbi:hypothetical protein SAMN05216267_1005222 [Actinacidiphila rubida]|uniref:Uncharacterized protein n=1 Tax=Actinacidiphila rubida TaxID=310780 RepID=A0A1H8GQJ2_9ACTN|nr:hypothetical protein SAMN05216267_1005222 [Actinacidiphila rubida]